MTQNHSFSYDTTFNWNNLHTNFISAYQVLIFSDTRPYSSHQPQAFQQYMENGGAWMGLHFSAFALTPLAYPQNRDWYHTKFLGSGEYAGNAWRPTAAILKVEEHIVAYRLIGLPGRYRTETT